MKEKKQKLPLNWEEKMFKRKYEEEQGKREPLVPSTILSGGDFKIEGRMSRDEFKKKHNKHGLFDMFNRKDISSGAQTPLQPGDEMDDIETINLMIQ